MHGHCLKGYDDHCQNLQDCHMLRGYLFRIQSFQRVPLSESHGGRAWDSFCLASWRRLSKLAPLKWWKLTDEISAEEVSAKNVVGRCWEHALKKLWLCSLPLLLAGLLSGVPTESICEETVCMWLNGLKKILVCSFVYTGYPFATVWSWNYLFFFFFFL